jgi:hypothetical protein
MIFSIALIVSVVVIGVALLAAAYFLVMSFLRYAGKSVPPNVVFRTRDELPPLSQLIGMNLFGKKSHSPATPTGTSPQISIRIEDFCFHQKDLVKYEKLCGDTDKAVQFLFPHVLAQKLLLNIVASPHFPVSGLGSLHLRSYFEIFNNKQLKQFLTTGDNHSSSTATTNGSGDYTMEANYWGRIPNQKRGTDIFVTFELFHNNLMNKQGTMLYLFVLP